MIVKNANDVGALIRQRRIALGWDQQALARKVGVGRLWVVHIEQGKPRAHVALVLRALDVLGLDVHVAPEDARTGPEIPDIDAIVAAAKGSR